MTASAPHPYGEAAAPHDRIIAGIAAVLLLIGMPIGWLPGDTSTGDVIAMIVAILIVLGLMAAIFLRLLPRMREDAEKASRATLILGILSIAAGLVFWTGLPFAIGAGAVALGLSMRERGGDGRAMAGLVLGSVAVVGSFVLLLVG